MRVLKRDVTTEMDWNRYLPQQEAAEGSDEQVEGSAASAPAILERSLSGIHRARLGISQTWYTLVETLGLQRLKAIISGVNTLPPSNDRLYLLGKEYESLNLPQAPGDSTGAAPGGGRGVEERTEAFAEDMASRVWVTYRSGFSMMGSSGLTTDAGWGCTIRSGQMLLANCLFLHFKGREWRRKGLSEGDEDEKEWVKEILSLFYDTPLQNHYLSIHNVVAQGKAFGITPGHWVGPYVLSQTFGKIINGRGQLSPLALYLAASEAGGIPTLYKSKGYAQATNTNLEKQDSIEGKSWKPLLILIPVTLGVTPSINPCYVPQILTVLSMPQSVGIIGGKPGSSVYVVGRQGERILYLDPHTLKPSHLDQDASYAAAKENEVIDSYFCDSIHHMLAAKLDPSLALGFYCRSKAAFDNLYNRLERLNKKHPTTSLVSIAEEPLPEKESAYDLSTTEIEGGFEGIM